MLAAATALRLSYFNVHGLDPDSGTYTGLPTDLAIIGFVALMLLDGPLDSPAFRVVLSVGVVAIAGLMVSSMPIPKLTGRSYVGVIVAGLVLAALHADSSGELTRQPPSRDCIADARRLDHVTDAEPLPHRERLLQSVTLGMAEQRRERTSGVCVPSRPQPLPASSIRC